MKKFKYAAILGGFGSCSDRFVGSGYSESKTLRELFDCAAMVEGLKGIELVSTWHITESNVEFIRHELERTGLQLVSIIPDHFGEAKWARGSFVSRDSTIRNEAVRLTKMMMDIAAELGGNTVSLWPGQDGYDYPFQDDYIQADRYLVDGIRECAAYRQDVRVAVEYKIKEPRTHSYISTVSRALLMVNEIGLDNVGVTIDFGHSLNCYENPAEAVALLKVYGDKLFHLHLNDNYRLWDDDMIVGSIHTIEYLEFLYWLDRTGYDGWFSMDQYPYREDGKRAIQESIKWTETLYMIMDKMGRENIERVIDTGDATEVSRLIREALSGVAFGN